MDDDTLAVARARHAKGGSVTAIAKALGIGRATVVPPPRRERLRQAHTDTGRPPASRRGPLSCTGLSAADLWVKGDRWPNARERFRASE
ncbi:hypothetical protein ACF1FX_09605 [Streptomyces sp. NPDC014646]|uniref:hypothetical protein n=1 Tax=Streptomyces sp. NPDC014646 TaxID=3364877 RepID=UPI0036FC22E6